MARAVAALPAPSSAVSGISGGGGGGGSSTGRQQLVLVMAGERGLVVVDAARGVLVQELSGARGGGRESSGHDGSRCGGGGRGVSHLAVTPDGEAFFSVGDVSSAMMVLDHVSAYRMCLVRSTSILYLSV